MNPYTAFLFIVGAIGVVVGLIAGAFVIVTVGATAIIGGFVIAGVRWEPIERSTTKSSPASLKSERSDF